MDRGFASTSAKGVRKAIFISSELTRLASRGRDYAGPVDFDKAVKLSARAEKTGLVPSVVTTADIAAPPRRACEGLLTQGIGLRRPLARKGPPSPCPWTASASYTPA